jgi:hypothetical protein
VRASRGPDRSRVVTLAMGSPAFLPRLKSSSPP